MKLINLNKKQHNYIWSTRALVGENLRLLDNVLVEVKNNQIIKISQAEKVQITDEDVIFLDNITLMPGLIDAHVHLALDGKNFKLATSLWNQEKSVNQKMRRHLHAYLDHGVVAVRDGGDSQALNLSLAKSLTLYEEQAQPKVIATGQALRKQAKYGSFLGQGLTTKEEITSFIIHQAKAGINQLKVLLSGIVSFKEFGKVGDLQFNPEELKLIVNTAHAEGLKVMTHASSAQAVAIAIDAGVDSIEHGYFLEEVSLYRMAEKEIAWVPTVIPVAAQIYAKTLKTHLTEQEIEVITRVHHSQLERLSRAEFIGVTLGLGTDAGATGVYHAASLFQEILQYSRAGLSNQTIIKAVTINNAKILGVEKILGSIDKKKEPRLIGVQGNPLKNLKALNKISFVLR